MNKLITWIIYKLGYDVDWEFTQDEKMRLQRF